jgi:hypothetical protein
MGHCMSMFLHVNTPCIFLLIIFKGKQISPDLQMFISPFGGDLHAPETPPVQNLSLSFLAVGQEYYGKQAEADLRFLPVTNNNSYAPLTTEMRPDNNWIRQILQFLI